MESLDIPVTTMQDLTGITFRLHTESIQHPKHTHSQYVTNQQVDLMSAAL